MFFNAINTYKELMESNKDNNNTKINDNNKKNWNEKVHPIDIYKLLNLNSKDIGKDIVEKYLDIYTKFKSDINSVNIQPDEKNISEIINLLIIFISSYYTLSKRPAIYEFDKEEIGRASCRERV